MTKHKVAILTLPLHTNFGGNIQAYALQKVLNDLGADAKLINIQRKPLNVLRSILSVIKQIIKRYVLGKSTAFKLTNYEYSIASQNHREFIEKNISLTEPIYHISQISTLFDKNQYHAIFVGSDQVWRKAYTPRIESYFLDFLQDNTQIKKIAYAASFGLDSWQYDEEQTKKLSQLAKKFDYISVREDSAVELCKKHLNIGVQHVIDPTLLLSKGDYLNLCKGTESKNKGKIFAYILDEAENKEKILNHVSKKIAKDLFSISIQKKKKDTLFIDNIEDFVAPPIQEWIKAFDDADFIVTDSFHGMVFSIIFNKPFLAIVNKKRGASRFYSLLKYLNLEDRVIEDDLAVLETLDYQVDYHLINVKLEEKRSAIKASIVELLG